jgi:hypothetical protein
MHRKPRFAPPHYALHITQRVFVTGDDRHRFLSLAPEELAGPLRTRIVAHRQFQLRPGRVTTAGVSDGEVEPGVRESRILAEGFFPTMSISEEASPRQQHRETRSTPPQR